MTALTPRQDRFVRAYCGHLNASRAAREAGYSCSSGADAVTGHRLLRLDKVQGAIRAVQQAQAAELEITRQEVISAVLEAIRTAKEQGVPSIMIRGLSEIAKLLGFYDPASLAAEKRRQQVDSQDGLQYLPTAELVQRISTDGDLRSPDGSAMTLEQVDAFYATLSTDELTALAEGRARLEVRVVQTGDMPKQSAD